MHKRQPNSRFKRQTDAKAHGTWRPHPQRSVWSHYAYIDRRKPVLRHLYRRCDKDEVFMHAEVKNGKGGTGGIRGIQERIRTGRTTYPEPSNRRWRRIRKGNAPAHERTRHQARSHAAVHARAKWRCRTSEQNHLREGTCNPHRNWTPEAFMGRTSAYSGLSEEQKPDARARRKNPVRSAIRH